MCLGYMQILHHFMQETRAIMDFGILGESWKNPPQIPRDNCMYIQTHTDKNVFLFPQVLNLDTMVMKLSSLILCSFLLIYFVQKKERHWGQWGSQTSGESLSVPDFDSCQDQLQTTPPIPPGKLKTSFLYLSTPTCWRSLSGPNVMPTAISTQLSPLSCCLLSNGSFSFWNL